MFNLTQFARSFVERTKPHRQVSARLLSPLVDRLGKSKLGSRFVRSKDSVLFKNQSTTAELSKLQSHPTQAGFDNAPINWIPASVLIATPLLAVTVVPWYLMTHDVKPAVWGVFAGMMVWTGMSITTGYHRLLSHRAYKAHPVVRNSLILGATFAVQGSAFDWCSGHRTHHRHVDNVMQDPYSAKRGFWFSHIGWMLRNYPSGQFDYKNIKDLTSDKLLQIQHKYYGLWVLATNVGAMAGIGWLIGDVWGTLIVASLLRLVLTHHFTFFINSLCHMLGTQPYTDTNTARDNFLLAIPTWGEGYHNYHHFFQYDYRNGVKWWQYDPTKWLIAGLSKVGLASDLRTVDDATIRHAEVNMRFKQVSAMLDDINKSKASKTMSLPARIANVRDKVTFELNQFQETVNDWQALKKQAVELKKTEYADRLHEVDALLHKQFSNIEHRINRHNRELKRTVKSLQDMHVA